MFVLYNRKLDYYFGWRNKTGWYFDLDTDLANAKRFKSKWHAQKCKEAKLEYYKHFGIYGEMELDIINGYEIVEV